MMTINATVGFYGKLPIIGDFVSRRLPSEFITPWDNWLQSAIAASRETLGENWLNCYLTSPIWRFLLSPGVCGDKAVAGIVMPSVDRVGRYYPLTVAVVFEQSPPLPFLFTAGNTWFEQLEDVALTGLEGSLDLQDFDQLIQSIPDLPMPDQASVMQKMPADKKAFYVSMENVEHATDAFIALNEQLLTQFMSGYSLWCNAGSDHVPSALLVYEGLPPIGEFVELLRGKTSIENSATPAVTATTDSEYSSLSSILTQDNGVLSEFSWHSWAITHTGKRRKLNEDALLNRPEACLWVVADGMGGHKAGDIASQLIVNTLKDILPTTPLESYVNDVEQCLKNINTQLRQLAAKEYSDQLVGSTVVSLVCDADRCAFLWAGDSRLYRFREDKLQQLTQDHCEDDAPLSSNWSVKNANVITRAVGADDDLALDIAILTVLKGDIFLLCSDGLDKEVSFNEIEHIIKTRACQDIASDLINEALARGARDNVTVIVVVRT